jgi:hypothetical protein
VQICQALGFQAQLTNLISKQIDPKIKICRAVEKLTDFSSRLTLRISARGAGVSSHLWSVELEGPARITKINTNANDFLSKCINTVYVFFLGGGSVGATVRKGESNP